MLPVLLKDGYRERFSVGLLTAGGSLGLLFPPSLPVILYGVVAHVPYSGPFQGWDHSWNPDGHGRLHLRSRGNSVEVAQAGFYRRRGCRSPVGVEVGGPSPGHSAGRDLWRILHTDRGGRDHRFRTPCSLKRLLIRTSTSLETCRGFSLSVCV